MTLNLLLDLVLLDIALPLFYPISIPHTARQPSMDYIEGQYSTLIACTLCSPSEQ
jgi:hypothetical protein